MCVAVIILSWIKPLIIDSFFFKNVLIYVERTFSRTTTPSPEIVAPHLAKSVDDGYPSSRGNDTQWSVAFVLFFV